MVALIISRIPNPIAIPIGPTTAPPAVEPNIVVITSVKAVSPKIVSHAEEKNDIINFLNTPLLISISIEEFSS